MSFKTRNHYIRKTRLIQAYNALIYYNVLTKLETLQINFVLFVAAGESNPGTPDIQKAEIFFFADKNIF